MLQGFLPSALFTRGLPLDTFRVTAVYTAGLAAVTSGLDPVASDLVVVESVLNSPICRHIH